MDADNPATMHDNAEPEPAGPREPEAAQPEPAPKRAAGRPKGSKDKKPRVVKPRVRIVEAEPTPPAPAPAPAPAPHAPAPAPTPAREQPPERHCEPSSPRTRYREAQRYILEAHRARDLDRRNHWQSVVLGSLRSL